MQERTYRALQAETAKVAWQGMLMILRLAARKAHHGMRCWWQRARLERELSALSDHLLKDMGFDRSEIPVAVRSYCNASRLLERMLARIGIDSKRAWQQFPELMRNIRQRCGVCSARWTCRHWLDFDEPRDGYRLFCPNSSALDTIRNDQSRIGCGGPQRSMPHVARSLLFI